MSDQDAFEHILASLYEAMLDDAYWPTTSALIDEACGMQGNALLVGAGPPDDVRVLFVGLYYRGERREDLERDYLAHYHPIDERVPRVRQLPDSRLVHITELYTAEELKTSLTYNEIMERSNGQNGLNVRLDGPADSHITWSISDPVTPGGWEDSQIRMIEGLLPHIRQFVRIQQALAQAGALGASVSDLLDTPRIGVIHLDWRGRIIEANDRARRLLRHGDGLTERGGELQARSPADRARFGQLVANALPTAGPVAVSGSMTLQRASRRLPFVVHVNPVGALQPDYGAWRVAALVLIVEPGYQPHVDPTLVAAALRLTPMESQVAVRIAAGQTVREIAVALGRTSGAVHWHLRHIYQKHGLRGHADLVRLVLSLTTLA